MQQAGNGTMTLKQVFESMNLTPYDLTIDMLDCHAVGREEKKDFEADLYLRSQDHNERNWYSQMLCSKDPIVKFPLSQEWLKM